MSERRGIDGVSDFFGLRWETAERLRVTIRPDLINAAGLLSGPVAYAMVDYCMGSTLWRQIDRETERIATINIAINYVQTATEGDVICETVLDRRNRTVGVLRSEVRHEDGRLLATAVGSFAIVRRRGSSDAREVGGGSDAGGAGAGTGGAG